MTQVGTRPEPLSSSEKFWRYLGTRPLAIYFTPLIFLVLGFAIAVKAPNHLLGAPLIVLTLLSLAIEVLCRLRWVQVCRRRGIEVEKRSWFDEPTWLVDSRAQKRAVKAMRSAGNSK